MPGRPLALAGSLWQPWPRSRPPSPGACQCPSLLFRRPPVSCWIRVPPCSPLLMTATGFRLQIRSHGNFLPVRVTGYGSFCSTVTSSLSWQPWVFSLLSNRLHLWKRKVFVEAGSSPQDVVYAREQIWGAGRGITTSMWSNPEEPYFQVSPASPSPRR